MKKERQPSYRWDFKSKKEIIHKWMDQQTNTSQSLHVLVMNFIDRYGYVDVTDYEVQKQLNLDTERLKFLGQEIDKDMLNKVPISKESPLESIEAKISGDTNHKELTPEGFIELPKGNMIGKAEQVELEKKLNENTIKHDKRPKRRIDYSKLNTDNI